jgi:hypothetical protein
MSTTPMAPSALDFLVDDHDLTASVPGAHFVRAGTAVPSATRPVPEATPTPLKALCLVLVISDNA